LSYHRETDQSGPSPLLVAFARPIAPAAYGWFIKGLDMAHLKEAKVLLDTLV
jgi:hypothetical protein